MLLSLAWASPSAVGQVTVATLPAGTSPFGVAVNSVTNKTYVANIACDINNLPCPSPGTVTVIDGATNSTTTLNVGVHPYAVAVNPVTNKIYVANNCGNDLNCRSLSTVTVIDGATNNTVTVNAGAFPYALAVNSATNKIYVANICGGDLTCSSPGTVTVIDGATNNTATVTVGNFPEDVEVNSATNQIYVVNNCGGDNSCSSPGGVTVIDGVSNNATTVNVGAYPYFAAVDSVTNQIYVTNNCGNDLTCSSAGTVTVIDGATKNTTTVNVGIFPYGIAVNATTNYIYVANECGNDITCGSAGTVTVINGATNNTTSVNVGVNPGGVAVNSVANETYVPNQCGNDLTCKSAGTVTVINGATNNTVPVAVGDGPQTLAVNATTDRIYVPNFTDGTVSVIAGDTALQFVPVTPCRLVDTRNPNGEFGGPPLQRNSVRSFTIPDNKDCNIPSTAAAYSLNVTVVPHGFLGYLTVWPTGENRPLVSTLNSYDGRVKANAAIVPAGTQGAVSFYVTNTTDLVLDIDGYFAPVSSSTLAFYPLPPCRVADTRNPNGDLGGPYLKGGVNRDFPILEASSCNIPNTAHAYSLNFTVVPHGFLGYLTVCPTPEDRSQDCPLISTLNSYGGQVVANAAIVPAGTGGEVRTFASNDTDLVIDINGYFAAPGKGGLSLYPLAPCRVLDTRLAGGLFVRTLPVNVVGSVCEPPNTAQAYVLNATVVPAGFLGYLTLWPDGAGRPLASTLNSYDGAITSNMAIVPTNNGSIDAFATNPTQLILDISSYFGP